MNKIGLKINPKNTQVVHMNTTNCNPILFNKKPLEDVGEFIYMGSICHHDWRLWHRHQHQDQQSQFLNPHGLNYHSSTAMSSASSCVNQNAGRHLWHQRVNWKSSNLKPNASIRHMLKIFWPNVISNGEPLKRNGMSIISETMKKTLALAWFSGHMVKGQDQTVDFHLKCCPLNIVWPPCLMITLLQWLPLESRWSLLLLLSSSRSRSNYQSSSHCCQYLMNPLCKGHYT